MATIQIMWFHFIARSIPLLLLSSPPPPFFLLYSVFYTQTDDILSIFSFVFVLHVARFLGFTRKPCREPTNTVCNIVLIDPPRSFFFFFRFWRCHTIAQALYCFEILFYNFHEVPFSCFLNDKRNRRRVGLFFFYYWIYTSRRIHGVQQCVGWSILDFHGVFFPFRNSGSHVSFGPRGC
jgi:hypothetical protein